MDLLAQRYASPFLILEEFIRLHQLHDFVTEVIKTIAEEKVHDTRWQFYLHKIYNMTWEEFVKTCEEPQETTMTHEQIADTISESKNLLEGFNPS